MSDRIIWTAARIARAAKLWAEGQTAAAIAADLGCPRNAIVGLADRHRDRFPKRRKGGVVAPPSGSPAAVCSTTEARLELVAPLWRAGLTVTDITQRTGLTRNQVNWLVRQHPDRLPPRRRGFAAASHPMKLKAVRTARKESFVPFLSCASLADGGPGADSSAPSLSVASGSLTGTPADPPAKADAFRPLPGTHPVPLWADEATGCRWPVHVDGSDPMARSTLFVCNAAISAPPLSGRPLAGTPCSYCATHAALANGEGSWAERRAIRDARRAA